MAIQVSRGKPGCIVFMIDRSASMGQTSGTGDQTLADLATDAVNKALFELAVQYR